VRTHPELPYLPGGAERSAKQALNWSSQTGPPSQQTNRVSGSMRHSAGCQAGAGSDARWVRRPETCRRRLARRYHLPPGASTVEDHRVGVGHWLQGYLNPVNQVEAAHQVVHQARHSARVHRAVSREAHPDCLS